MSLAGFEKEIASSPQVGENDRLWFPRWIRRYALNFRKGLVADLPVNGHSVIRFSKGLLRNGAPAWQRWQAVRAVESYRDLVLHRSEPDLSYVISTLARLAHSERNLPLDAPPTEEELRQLRGNVNPHEHPSIQTMRGELRVLHDSMATEKAYVRWVKRFGKHVGSMELDQFDELDIGTFLTSLAVEGHVSTSTQNQAQSGLFFLYQCVL